MANKNYNSTLQSNNTDLQAILDAINELPEAGGVELPNLTNPATQDEVFLNQEYIDENGEKKTGTFTIDSELTQQDSLIAQIQSAIDELPDAGSGGSSGGIETCTVVITDDGSPLGPGMEPIFYYVDQNGTIQQIASVSCTLTVMKNSIIAITGWSAGSNGTGQCSEIFYGIGNAAYSINGDSTLTYKG